MYQKLQHLTLEQKQQITEKIRQVEANTQGELVTIIAQQSDDYYYIPTLWAALIALVSPLLFMFTWITLSLGQIIFFQLVLFSLLALLFRWSPIKMRLVSKSVKFHRAHRHAQELFFIQGLHLTEKNSAVMIFVSVKERYVEIMADTGIQQHVDNEQWQSIVDQMISSIRRGQVAQGFLAAVEACGRLLVQYCPCSTAKPINELPDHLIEI